MSLAATIHLDSASVTIGQKINAVVTIANSGVVPVSITTMRPTVVETGDSNIEDATSCSKVMQLPNINSSNIVPASGSSTYSFQFNIHAPSLKGSGSVYTGPQLGSADSFAILAGSAITNTGASVINGDVGVSPGSAITPGGWTVNGTVHNADAAAALAQVDLTTAYNFCAAKTPTQVLTGQDLGTVGPLGPGVYFFASSAGLTGTLTLDGQNDPNSVWIFQIGTTLTTATSSAVVMINGGVPGNVFFQVGSSATLGTSSAFLGNILALTSITENGGAGASSGRLLARNGAVTISAAATSSTEKNSSQLPGSGSYSVSCQIEAADGQNLSPVPATITVLPTP